MSKSRSVTVLLAALFVLAGANLGAFAATGGPLLIGKGNSASKTTTLKAAKGSALSLRTRDGAPPIKVNSGRLVTRLNADKIDGHDAVALRNRSYTYVLTGTGLPGSNRISHAFPGLPPGRYLASYTVFGGVGSLETDILCQIEDGGTSILLSAVGTPFDSDIALVGVSASGFVDTTAAPHILVCQAEGSAGLVIADPDEVRSEVTFLRLDDHTLAQTELAP